MTAAPRGPQTASKRRDSQVVVQFGITFGGARMARLLRRSARVEVYRRRIAFATERGNNSNHAATPSHCIGFCAHVISGHRGYMVGDEIELVYFIASGKVKLVMNSSEGKECTLAIHAAGDIFGELCLSGLAGRLETATAMEDTVVKPLPCNKFLERLASDSLLVGFVKYLAVRVADQQEVIANLVTVDSEQRRGKTLLQLARKLGKKDPRSIRIDLRISHEELASMVGTTRSRVSVFMQRFRNLGLLELSEEHHIIIKEHKLTAYLTTIA